MADHKRLDEPTGTETVGHEWDGIEELNTPLPRWWLWTFYATMVFAIGYCVVYPAFPGANGKPGGMANWSSRDQLEATIAARDAEQKPLRDALSVGDINQLIADPKLMQAAVAGGGAAFRVHCTQCHGAGAAGSRGYPNLNDDDWLWGGDLATIEKTILDGIRQPEHKQTRFSQMPAFGRDGILTATEINDLASYLRAISKQENQSASSARGAQLFAANCVACHGSDGKGMRALGAPNLTDAIWLYGGDRASIVQTVTNSRYGVMPAWGGKLDKATVRMLAAYVHSLGGGEAQPEKVADEKPGAAKGGGDGPVR